MKRLALILFAALAAQASTVTFLGAKSEFGPYDISFDGVATQGICISPFTAIGATWQAISLPLADPLTLRLEWLAEEFASHATEYVAIQEAIWYLRGLPSTDYGVLGWVYASAGKSPSANNWAVLVPTLDGASQDLLWRDPNGPAKTPEPGTFLLYAGLFFLILFGWILDVPKGGLEHFFQEMKRRWTR